MASLFLAKISLTYRLKNNRKNVVHLKCGTSKNDPQKSVVKC